MLGKALIAGVITLAIIGTSGQMLFPPKPVLFYNPSYSAPVGWYKLRVNEPIVTGAQVAAYAPEWARIMADERGYLPYDYPLIKTVWAVYGDEVCYNNGSLRVPKRPDIAIRAGCFGTRYASKVGLSCPKSGGVSYHIARCADGV